MASDIFLKIDGIEGESFDDKHKNEIDVMSFSWGVSQTGSFAAGGGGGAGKAQFQDLHFNTNMSKASPKLFLACASGKHIPQALLTARKAGGTPIEYLKIKFTDVLISSYQTGGSSGDIVPTDQVSLNFAKIEFSFFSQDPKGGLAGETKAGWDVKANKAV